MTAPLVPAIVDLRGFQYMPLDVVRLRDSKIVSHTSGEGFRCAVLLWCVSWHQVPAASLPNDEIQLAQFAGFGRSLKEFRKISQEAMHGWILCSDDRWYHETVAEKALEAWEQKLQQRWKTDCARIKKAAQRNGFQPIYPTYEDWREHFEATGLEQWSPSGVPAPVPRDVPKVSPGTGSNVPRETPSKGTEGNGRDLSTPVEIPTPPASANQEQVRSVTSGTSAGAIAAALNRKGLRITSQNPNVIAAAAEGVTVEHLLELHEIYPDKPASYLVATARRQRTERANPIAPGAKHAQPPGHRPSLADRARRSPGAAGSIDSTATRIKD